MADTKPNAPAKRRTARKSPEAAAPTTPKKKVAAPATDIGKQTQAATPAPKPKRQARQKPADKSDTVPAGSGRGRGRQQQAGGALAGIDAARSHLSGKGSEQGGDQSQGSAGGGSAGKDESADAMRGGTKQVLIEYTKMSPRIGRASPPEEYPFGDLTAAKKIGGEIEGPSFFIPDTDKAKNRIAAARKRHSGVTFWTRREMAPVNGEGPKVMGTRVFKAPPGSA